MNAFSIKNKYIELNEYLCDNNIDICAITETWLDASVDSNEFTLDDFLCFRKDRNLDFYAEGMYSKWDRGGAMLLIRRNLNPVIYTKGDVDTEVIYPSPKTDLLIGAVYRPERGGEPNLIKMCNSINAIDSDNTIIVGDFNFREIDWDQCEASSNLAKKFLSCLEDNLLFQLVKEPTRGANILDLVLTGNTDIVHSVSVGEKLGASDHNSVLIQLRIPVPRIALSDRKVYLYSKGDYDGFTEAVKATDWDSVFANNRLCEKWRILQSKYNEWKDEFIPSKLVKSGQRHKPPWSNYRSVKRAKRKKRKAAVNARKSGLNVHQEEFLSAKSNVDNVVKKAKMDYESVLVNQRSE
jgi:hypothetical protein